jgi:hypothetical protein
MSTEPAYPPDRDPRRVEHLLQSERVGTQGRAGLDGHQLKRRLRRRGVGVPIGKLEGKTPGVGAAAEVEHPSRTAVAVAPKEAQRGDDAADALGQAGEGVGGGYMVRRGCTFTSSSNRVRVRPTFASTG